MDSVMQEQPVAQNDKSIPVRRYTAIRTWLFSWEIYFIVIVASFLRLYQLNDTEFDVDEANIFRMAHDAVIHGHLVATANLSSVGSYNPPATIYLLMVPAWFSSNPLGGDLFTALLGILSVVVTYWFARRYYGRVVGTIAACVYATTEDAIRFTRLMWNQDFLPLFVILFIAVLFWGAVEKRKGWLGPALILLGLLYQFHPTAALLALPLAGAILLAPKTLRWRDVGIGIAGCVIIYAPYIIWLITTNFHDIQILLSPNGNQPYFSKAAWTWYKAYLVPYGYSGNNPYSVVFPYARFIAWIPHTMELLLAGGILLALLAVFWSRNASGPSASLQSVQRSVLWRRLWNWWTELQATPLRCGLVILLLWQAAALCLVRTSVPLHLHYFIIFMPGQYILIGFCIGKVIEWLQRRRGWERILRILPYSLAILIIATQFLTTLGLVVDWQYGNIHDGGPSQGYFNEDKSLVNAVNEADQLAQQRHLGRIYIYADSTTQWALRYLGSVTHVPSTVVNDPCFVLPGPAYGPAVVLASPYSYLTDDLATHFGHATLVDSPVRVGGFSPFRLYIVNPPAQSAATAQPLSQALNFMDAQSLTAQKASWLVTRWSFQNTEQPTDRTTFTFEMTNSAQANNPPTDCIMTAMRAGDQLFVPYQKPPVQPLSVGVTFYATRPYTIAPGFLNLHFDTFMDVDDKHQLLTTRAGKDSIKIAASQ